MVVPELCVSSSCVDVTLRDGKLNAGMQWLIMKTQSPKGRFLLESE